MSIQHRNLSVLSLFSVDDTGAAPAWRCVALTADCAEMPTDARVRAATGIDGATDLFGVEEVSTDELAQLTAIVFITSAVLAISSGAIVGGNYGASHNLSVFSCRFGGEE